VLTLGAVMGTFTSYLEGVLSQLAVGW
jgi:hypothetical protein